jgi:ABC-type antimicrobial peptide transport system permease subunit
MGEALVRDLLYGLRALRKSPVLSAAAILTLGLAIGASTAIFSVVRAVLLAPLPFTYTGCTLLLLAITLTASYIPAHRAARVNPMVALREE